MDNRTVIKTLVFPKNKNIHFRHLLFLLVTVLFLSCKKEKQASYIPPSPSPVSPVLLKDIVIPNLPSPYYHFDYNAVGRPSFVSFASGLNMYDVSYNGDRIIEMRNNIIVNKDRLQYFYNNLGRVNSINYADSTGIVYAKIHLSYSGEQLIKLERERKTGVAFIIEKTLTFSYQGDGNLIQINDHRPAINGQAETTTIDWFEQYDDKINVDGFSLLHNEFFDHLVFLPGVQLQKNNPGKETRSGDGLNYVVNYHYTYNDRLLPLIKSGEGLITSGPTMGNRFQTSSIYTYY